MLVTVHSAAGTLAHPKHKDIRAMTVSIFLEEEMGLTENQWIVQGHQIDHSGGAEILRQLVGGVHAVFVTPLSFPTTQPAFGWNVHLGVFGIVQGWACHHKQASVVVNSVSFQRSEVPL